MNPATDASAVMFAVSDNVSEPAPPSTESPTVKVVGSATNESSPVPPLKRPYLCERECSTWVGCGCHTTTDLDSFCPTE